MSAVVERCDLAILNGTIGTATQCLLAGVPLVLVPPYLEQTVFSRRVFELGAALSVPPNRTELLAGRVWRVLDDERFRQAARSFEDRRAGYDPEQVQGHIVNRIKSLLTSRTANPDTRPCLTT
jgi:UDP:flavonoid glycosyltransferase YjiC (YdhE family)